MRMMGGTAAALAILFASGCAVRLGGPKPETYQAAAVHAQNEDAAALGARLRSAGLDFALVAAEQDSAWFARLGEGLGLPLSGPGRTGTPALALYSRLKMLGDTSIALAVEGGGHVHMQDALFEIGKDRHLDLMMVQIETGTETRAAVRRLLEYYATDVGNSAAVVLAVNSATPAVADSVALLLRSAFGNALACEDEAASVTGGAGGLRLFYGPQARIECERGTALPGPSSGLTARLTVGR